MRRQPNAALLLTNADDVGSVRCADAFYLSVRSCADNAAFEGFFGMLKRERVNRCHYETHAQARADIFDCIERFYNPRRRRKIEGLKQRKSNLTQPSVVSG
jgi:putative transposase